MPERLSQPAETTDSLSETRAVRHCADNFRHTARIVAQAIEDSDYSYGIAQLYCEEPPLLRYVSAIALESLPNGDDDYAVTIYLLEDGQNAQRSCGRVFIYIACDPSLRARHGK